MAFTTQPAQPVRKSNIIGQFARPFLAVWQILVLAAEQRPIMDEVSVLNAQSDESLAARGTTRDGEVRRIFANYMGC